MTGRPPPGPAPPAAPYRRANASPPARTPRAPSTVAPSTVGRDGAAALARAAALVAEHAGIDPPDWILEARLAERAGVLPLARYVDRLARDPGELDALVEALRVPETRFFRHPGQLDALARRLIDATGAVRAWSAGCATGEEAWTLAMLLAELGRPFELLATDLSDDALAVARAGRYPRAAVERIGAARRRRFLVDAGSSEVLVADELRRAVRFERHNLHRDPYPTGRDVVLCRNVLIYFRPAERAGALARLARSVVGGGLLLLGTGESAPAPFEPLRDGRALLFRRRADAPARRPALTGSSTPPRPPTAPDPRHVVRGDTARRRAGARSAGNDAVAATGDRAASTTRDSPRAARRVSSGDAALAMIDAVPPGARVAADGARVVRLAGTYPDGARLRRELSAALGNGARVIDLDGVAYFGAAAVPVLARFAGAAPPGLVVRARRAAVRHFLARHDLDRRLPLEPPADRRRERE